MSGNRKIRYAYAADGTRLKTVHRQWKNSAWLRDSTEYFGNLIFKNGIPSMYRFGGGYYAFNNGLLSDCHFYIQDYLGSNRMVVNKNGTVKQTTHYYPYGGIIGGKSTYPEYQSYKHTDKELDRTNGLEWYDVHARQYDPVVPSWHTIDPLAEKYYYISPYAYCANNPVNCVDFNGLYPKGLLNYHKSVFYRADYYTFTKPAAHLLSIVTGVKEEYICGVNVMEKGLGREYPFYNPNSGGGGITIGSNPNSVTMTFTKNFFADDALDYNGNGYGQNVIEWLDIVSHEATHIKHIEQAGGKIKYLAHFLTQYVKYGGHDTVPEEIEADANRNVFRGFSNFVNSNHGKNSLQNLFNAELSDEQKIRQIDDWWKEWIESEEKK